ncbi:hypothetical protein FXV83_40465 [Bradyrhizobium hipponense]|uniref:MotA/TolQ/ExbB proton channel domain-containing protein n=1 Tax=Bradyrhizobium hipponense TaxID=2605638 RepID=A0A5S4YL33_9BRAD|nr:hypothetical protein [Bradyrhizobium hipponense]TYO61029.1 hypothetical protein FXV83_40465 [Bradyrhizobium hipponense]
MDRLVALTDSVWQLFLSLPPITQWAVSMLLICLVIAHAFKYNEHTVHEGPSIFTTAGIFFTFLGIAEGLYQFDPQKIDASIPTLLDGLKTAFIASVVGVGAALTLKLRYAIFGVRHSNPAERSEGATVDDLYGQLVSLQRSLVGEGESTVISQLKLSRQDTNDRLDALGKSQAAFMQRLAESNSKALIIALQEVIRDFNSKITEQFGDNFKQLNEAVGAMLEWQEKYREQVGEMIHHQALAAENMVTASSRYEALVSNSESFSVTAKALDSLLNGLEVQRGQITESLAQLAQLLLAASAGLPQIETKIIQLTEQVTQGVKQNQDDMTTILRGAGTALQSSVSEIRDVLLETTQTAGAQMNEHVRTMSSTIETKVVQLDEQLTLGVKHNQDEMTKVLREAGGSLQSSIADVRNLLLETTQASSTQINDHVRSLGDKTTEQFAKLDAALETELSKSISSLGRQLTALSKQFVDDYTPLTDRLRAVVQMGRG